MTETSYSAVGSGPARICLSCGARLPGPALRCPRCGAVAGQRSGGAAKTLVIILAILFGSLPVVGILAAIAIPNFIRYQLRSKAQEVPGELHVLLTCQRSIAVDGGRYVALGPIPSSGRPGTERTALSAADLAAAEAVGWRPASAERGVYGRYRAAVAADDAGNEALALCGESDLDGNGELARWVAFVPLEVNGERQAPDAPCATPVPYEPRYGSGELVQISGPSVF